MSRRMRLGRLLVYVEGEMLQGFPRRKRYERPKRQLLWGLQEDA